MTHNVDPGNFEWAERDLNPQRSAYEAGTLTN